MRCQKSRCDFDQKTGWKRSMRCLRKSRIPRNLIGGALATYHYPSEPFIPPQQICPKFFNQIRDSLNTLASLQFAFQFASCQGGRKLVEGINT